MLYLSINGSDQTLSESKFKQTFENIISKKLTNDDQLTEQNYKDIESEFAKVLNPNQTRDMMTILRKIIAKDETAGVCDLLFIFQFYFFLTKLSFFFSRAIGLLTLLEMCSV